MGDKNQKKFIFVTGGVVSSIGKGISAATIGALLQARGYKVHLRKMDPYLNVDPGTMSPYQHGEVFVTDDGAETDLDLGHYERFTNITCNKYDSISSGKIFENVLKKERKGEYLGNTVQIIPHVTDEIKNYIEAGLDDVDFVICEIGGTVGDIEANPFLEAIRQFSNEKGRENVMFIHVTLMPYLPSSEEVKTKPTQHSVKELQRSGINANLLICRTEVDIDDDAKNKLALFCNIAKEDVIAALTCDNLFDVVTAYHKEGLDQRICEYFKLKDYIKSDLTIWKNLSSIHRNLQKETTLFIVGKYVKLKDAYKSLNEAIYHGGLANNVKVKVEWINADDLENISTEEISNLLKEANGILIPGGFGNRGTEGMIKAITYARENKIPCFGICLGMQMMVIEALRNVAKLDNVGSSEFCKYKNPVIGLIEEWSKNGDIEKRTELDDKGGTMRLGSYPCKVLEGSLCHKIYNSTLINERHRHRYEVDISYKKHINDSGFVISGMSPDGVLPEVVELQEHPWFLGVQFHPELKSRPFDVHPLFKSFVESMYNYSVNGDKNEK